MERRYFLVAVLVAAALCPISFILFYHQLESVYIPKSVCDEAISMISAASDRIYLAMYNFYYYSEFPDSCTNRIAEKIAEKHGKGVDVKVFLDDKKENEKVVEFFKEAGVPVYIYDGPYILHAKVLLVDGCILTGSSNYTYSGLFRNKEFNIKVCGDVRFVISWFEELERKCRRVS